MQVLPFSLLVLHISLVDVYELQLHLWMWTEIPLQSTIPHSSGNFKGLQTRVSLCWCVAGQNLLAAVSHLEISFSGEERRRRS